MSDSIKHECGIALIRLRKPLSYYKEKYGTPIYGIEKLYLLMEKQHNRGQDGAGVASLKLNPQLGMPYFDRYRSNSKSPIRDVFDHINAKLDITSTKSLDELSFRPFMGHIFLGHLRYGTYGGSSIEYVHPVMRSSNWLSRNLVLAGNFNLTNAGEIFNNLVEIGQLPRDRSDTVTVLEKIGYYLDKENQRIYRHYKDAGLAKKEIAERVAKELNVTEVLRNATCRFDGGYVIGGIAGNGDCFVVRDPNGIRPAFYYADDEVVVVASERPVIQTAFRLKTSDIQEIPRAHALIIKNDNTISVEQIREEKERKGCSFERIYFSRGTDKSIYRERKQLGVQLTQQILKAIDYDVVNTVFSYIPNTAESAFFGMTKGIEDYMLHEKHRRIMEAKKQLSSDELWEIITERPRVEKLAVKDAKMRTFITEGSSRNDMVEHVYDVTYGVIRRGIDRLVIIDDSIVRGTTLKQSIIKMLDKLEPKKIVIVSSCPQIRYPDCYGIDMSRMNEFAAFLAAIELLKKSGQEALIDKTYSECKRQLKLPNEEVRNCVKMIYEPFTAEQLSRKIAEMLTPEDVKAEVELVFQSLEGLHAACPNDTGDWYFSGNYPTPGGMRTVNRAFINYYEGRDERPY